MSPRHGATNARTREQVRQAVRAQSGRGLCTACLAASLGANKRTTEEAARCIEGDAEFRRAFGTCVSCGRDRLVISLRARRLPASQ